MTASHVLNSQQSNACPGAAGQAPCLLASGTTHRLHPRAPMQLRVVSGQAWVTLGTGAQGWREAGGDVVLRPGQSVCVAAGRRAVVEPLGREPLRYQWRAC